MDRLNEGVECDGGDVEVVDISDYLHHPGPHEELDAGHIVGHIPEDCQHSCSLAQSSQDIVYGESILRVHWFPSADQVTLSLLETRDFFSVHWIQPQSQIMHELLARCSHLQSGYVEAVGEPESYEGRDAIAHPSDESGPDQDVECHFSDGKDGWVEIGGTVDEVGH